MRESFAGGLIKPDKLAVMTREEMMSSERKAETKKAMEENIAEARTAPNQQAETDQFICGKCRSRKCTYYQMQTRSADEPMTTFVTCTNCRNAWKFC